MSDNSSLQNTLHDIDLRYRAVFEQAAVGIARIAPGGQWLEVNQRLCEITGYDHDALLERSFQSITHPDDQAADQQAMHRLLSAEAQSVTRDKRYLRADGSLIWVQVTASLVRTPDGSPAYIIAVVQDISQRKQAQLTITESERRYRAVLEASRDGFWEVDSQSGHLLDVNPIYCELSGYSREELIGHSIKEFDAVERPEEIERHIERVIRQGSGIFETLHRRKSGELWPVEVTVTYSDLSGGRFFVILREISERYTHQALMSLRQRLIEVSAGGTLDDLMRTALDEAERLTNSRIGFFHFVDPDQENLSLQVWSSNTLDTFCFAEGKGAHYPVSEAGVWVDCIHQRAPVIHNDYASLPHRKGLPEGHAEILRELTVPIIRDSLIAGVIGVGNKMVEYSEADIALVEQVGELVFDHIERKRAEERVQYMAFYDPLTGLPNRSLLFDRLEQALAQARRSRQQMALAYLDLDGFKLVNDDYGHDVGDHLLVAVAARLKAALRAVDTVARLGGDEFVLVLTEQSHPHDCEQVLLRVLESLRSPFHLGSRALLISASLGYTLFPLDDAEPETLLRHADQAMYQAKNSGKNSLHLYTPAQDKRREQRSLTLNQVAQGLRRGEFLLHYQPQVDLLSGEVRGTEALLRWNHPQHGRLAPDDFLPALEESDEESRLGEWVIEQALKQIVSWQERGFYAPVSVNLSPGHLRRGLFLDFMRTQSARYPRSVLSQLALELRESYLLQDLAQLNHTLEGCAELGMGLVLDGFGGHFSAIAYFHTMPIDLLKIDRTLIQHLPEHPDQINTVLALVELAHTYRAPLIAVGVDSLDLSALLIDLGCHLVQGHAIAHPMNPDALQLWRKSWPQDGYRDFVHDEEQTSSDALLKLAIRCHKRWSTSLIHYLSSKQPSLRPNLLPEQSHFARWYQGLGAMRYSTRPGFAFLAARHHTLYQLANELATLQESGHSAEVNTGLAEFLAEDQEFITRMHRLGEG